MSSDVKRRKLQHMSDEEVDAASFASFDSDDNDDISPAQNGRERPNGIPHNDVDDQDSDAPSDNDDEDVDGDAANDAVLKPGLTDVVRSGTRPISSLPPKKQAVETKSKKPVNGRLSASALTGGSIKANVFKMQIDQLLEKSRPVRNARAEAIEKTLHELKRVMESIPARAPLSITAAERDLIKKSRVAIPFPSPRPPQDAQYKLEFQKPTSINVIGSYAASLHLRGTKTLEVDMLVQMPDSLFQPKDYQDYRYFYRRSYYLACLAAGIRDDSGAKYKLEFSNHRGNPLRPVLVVTPSDAASTSASKWLINILPCVSTKVFVDEKLSISKSLVRALGAEDEAQAEPTALYNSSIQVDRQMTAYLKLIHSASSTCDGFKDAALLLRIWLKRRGFTSAVQGGGFGNFESTALLAALVTSGLLSARYGTYQLFKALLQFLATKDALKSMVVLGHATVQPVQVPNTPIILDGPRSHNILYKMTAWSYRALRTEARNTMSLLADNAPDQFEATFVFDDIEQTKYDMSLTLENLDLTSKSLNDHESASIHRRLHEVLARALGDRVVQINLTSDLPGLWDLGSARPAWASKGQTSVFLRLNPLTAGRTVDHGPSAEQKKEANAFQKFWGEKSELRRFKDGSIVESLVWSPRESDQAVILDIVKYILGRHFGPSIVASLRLLGGDASKLIPNTNGLQAFQPSMDAFKQLESDIRSLEGLPLAIRQISSADEQSRFASIDIPEPGNPVDVVLQFESSTRWPTSLTAIQRTKAAFLLLLSRLLTSSDPSLTCRVGLENASIPGLNQAFLSILSSTAHFHLRLHHDLELAFLQTELKQSSITPLAREATAQALASYKRTFLHLPSHTAFIAKLSTSFPALSPTIRLLKQWFASHHLSSHFPAPLIEVLALPAFLASHGPVPASAKTGLLRALVHLGRWDWRSTPLLLGPSSASSAAAPTDATVGKGGKEAWSLAARTHFQAWRQLDPALNRVVLFAAYECDPEGTAWSDVKQGGPGRLVAGRMTALAAAAVLEIESREMDIARLFVSGTGDFDFVLHLDPEHVGSSSHGSAKKGKKRASKGGFRNLELDVQEEGMEGFDPVKDFIAELEEMYAGSVVLFHGGRGSHVVCGLWNPVTAKRDWKVGLGWNSELALTDGSDATAALNQEAVLGEMARLGGELVKRIEVVRR